MKMSGLLRVLLVTSATLLFTAKGQSDYDMLREVEKKYVDMAITYANKNNELQKNDPKEHLNFFRIAGKSVIKAKDVKINLYLKATNCLKARSNSEHKHRNECGFKSGRPYIICVVCNKNISSTDAHIDCVRYKDVKELAIQHEKCSPLMHRGGATILASTNEEDLQTGCLGCF
ncbi:cystatin-like protein [Coregonus clupeaformis]|uniref:cystatin-like protein n=1 Tax=Coregonus clupeaformis TaxID=59861 RepID=UPI001BE0EDF4|nr:cystatin-like protein [Coregonus clupeaformis]